jgi:hypothetical protein
MPENVRCQWLDLSDDLDDDLLALFHAVPCEQREAFVRRLTWMAAPLWSKSTTDVLTEHLARITRVRIAERAATIDGESWGDDTRELMLRYGWPRWYTREPTTQLRATITGHDAGVPYQVFPDSGTAKHMTRARPGSWRLDDPFARFGYAPAYARSLHDLPSRLALFRRGDSTLIVAAWDASSDTTLERRLLRATLVAATGPDSVSVARIDSAGIHGSVMLTTPFDSGVVSMELVAPNERRAARLREGFVRAPSHAPALSSLLFYRPSGQDPHSLDDVVRLAVGGAETPRSLGVFWEAYDLPPDTAIAYTIAIERVGTSLVRRTLEKLRVVDRSSELRLQWREIPRQAIGIAPRGVTLDLSALRSARYRVTLSAAPSSGPALVTKGEIVLR